MTKLTDKDLKTRDTFKAREEEIAQAQAELEHAIVTLRGEWGFWRREIINPKYKLGPDDVIEDDGAIVHGG